MNNIWKSFDEQTRILDKPRFTRREAVAITGLSATQIKNMLVRNVVRLRHGNHTVTEKRGPGERGPGIKFCGGDILKLIAAHTMSEVGFPMRWSSGLADQVAKRAAGRIVGKDDKPGLVYATYPLPVQEGKDRDWACIALWEGMPDKPSIPVATQTLQVDRLIDETVAKLRAATARQAIPNFDVAAPIMEASPDSPQNDFFKRWSKDENGRDVLIGLTFEETQDFNALKDLWVIDRSQTKKNLFPPEAGERLTFLDNKHEAARMVRAHLSKN